MLPFPNSHVLVRRLALWIILVAHAPLLMFASASCSNDDNSDSSELSERQRNNAESCQSMQDTLETQGCENAFTTVRCEIYEDVSGDCVSFFQCLEDAACDVTAQGKCDDAHSSCGNPD